MKNDQEQHPITRVLTTLLLQICKRPNDLVVRETELGPNLVITVEPYSCDHPLLVGKGGRQIKALRALAERMGTTAGMAVSLDLEESMRGQRDGGGPAPIRNKAFTLDSFYDALVPLVFWAFGKGVETEVVEEDDEFVAYIDVPASETTAVVAIADLLFCVCKKQGRKCDVKTKASRKSVEAR